MYPLKESRKLDKAETLAKVETAFRGDLAYTGLTRQNQPQAEPSKVPVEVVETMGVEPTTSAMRVRRSPN